MSLEEREENEKENIINVKNRVNNNESIFLKEVRYRCSQGVDLIKKK